MSNISHYSQKITHHIKSFFCITLFASFAFAPVTYAMDPKVSTPILIQKGQAFKGRTDLSELFEKGVEALQNKDYKIAERAFVKIRREVRRDPAVNYYLGVAKFGNDKLKAARKYLEIAREGLAEVPQLRRDLALIYLEQNERGKAIQELAAIKTMLDACDENCPDTRRQSIASAGSVILSALENTTSQ